MSDGNSHFLTALGHHAGGTVIERADELLANVLSGVRRAGGKGHVVLKLEVKPNGNGYALTASVTAKVPELGYGESFWFADGNGTLSREAPPDELPNLISGNARPLREVK